MARVFNDSLPLARGPQEDRAALMVADSNAGPSTSQPRGKRKGVDGSETTIKVGRKRKLPPAESGEAMPSGAVVMHRGGRAKARKAMPHRSKAARRAAAARARELEAMWSSCSDGGEEVDMGSDGMEDVSGFPPAPMAALAGGAQSGSNILSSAVTNCVVTNHRWRRTTTGRMSATVWNLALVTAATCAILSREIMLVRKRPRWPGKGVADRFSAGMTRNSKP